MNHFFPETYRLNFGVKNYTSEEWDFLNTENGGVWLLKPCFENRGKGIEIIMNIKEMK
jgi:hypothetical protein